MPWVDMPLVLCSLRLSHSCSRVIYSCTASKLTNSKVRRGLEPQDFHSKSLLAGKGEFYSVVLLTDDRNLRVKAHASNLPVKDIPAFMELFKTTRR